MNNTDNVLTTYPTTSTIVIKQQNSNTVLSRGENYLETQNRDLVHNTIHNFTCINLTARSSVDNEIKVESPVPDISTARSQLAVQPSPGRSESHQSSVSTSTDLHQRGKRTCLTSNTWCFGQISPAFQSVESYNNS